MMARNDEHVIENALARLAEPQPRMEGLTIRLATSADMAFIDQLLKMHSHMVGFAPKKQLEANIKAEEVLLAEDADSQPLGYCIARDTYMKREDVGIIYQLNVLPLMHRKLVGAMLVKNVFERAAYGCRLFCCWCAQDIQANYFWESIGFIPLAFRTGSRAKQRIHIFWQKRIREGDTTTPWWFPSQTGSGAVREDRLVFPIPPDTHWRDAKPIVLPELEELRKEEAADRKWLPPARPNAGAKKSGEKKQTYAQKLNVIRSQSKHLKGVPKGKAAVVTSSGMKYIDRADAPVEEDEVTPKNPKQPRKPAKKYDPKLRAAVRELRDRYLEAVERDPGLLLPAMEAGKYDVSRALPEGAFGTEVERQEPLGPDRMLDAA